MLTEKGMPSQISEKLVKGLPPLFSDPAKIVDNIVAINNSRFSQYFGRVSGLSPALVVLAHTGLWLALLLPGFNVLQSWYQGALVYSRTTRGVTEAMGIFLLVTSTALWVGVVWGDMTGLYIGLVAFGLGSLAQTAWLWYRSRPVMRHLDERDAGGLSLPSASIETLRVSENP